MLAFILSTLASAASLLVVDALFRGVTIASFPVAIVAGLAIGCLNGSIRPILQFLSLPFTIVTLGLFSLVVNGFCFWLASLIVPGFHVDGFLAFLFAPIVLSIVNTIVNRVIVDRFVSEN
jgi:putative membrane protein